MTQKTKTAILVAAIITVSGLAVYYAYPEKPLPKNAAVTSIVVERSKHRMDVFSGNTLLKNYSVSLGRIASDMHGNTWDNITPTGSFVIDGKLSDSGYHKALTISYGNEVEIHGIKNGLGFLGKFQRWIDWTRGCIAVTDQEIDELYRDVPVGTPIVIKN